MGTKNSKGSISIERKENRIRLRWRFQTKRYSLNLFEFTKINLLKAKKIALQIEHDISIGLFDIYLESYKPNSRKRIILIEEKTLVKSFEDWVQSYRNMDCEKDNDYHSTRNMMLNWGKFDSSMVVYHFNKETFGAKTYNRRLTLLKSFFEWTTKSRLTMRNPLEDVLPKKVKNIEQPNRKPFTVEEIKQILESIKNNSFCSPSSNYKHSHYYPFIYFMFKTGVRNAEAIGLRVQNVDLKNNLIYIKEALARTLKGTNASARIRKNTKNDKERILPLTNDLKEILSPLLLMRKFDDLVFKSQTGLSIDDRMFQKRIFKKVLKNLNIEPRVLYACRHTFGSRCIHNGISPVNTAFLMGNSPATVLKNYTHQLTLTLELPDIN